MRNFRKLILQIIAGIVGLWLAKELVGGVSFGGPSQLLILAGAILGFLNFFLKPLLNLVTLPLRVITFGLFSLVINAGIVWVIDILFKPLIIPGIMPLIWTTLIVWGLGLIASRV